MYLTNNIIQKQNKNSINRCANSYYVIHTCLIYRVITPRTTSLLIFIFILLQLIFQIKKSVALVTVPRSHLSILCSLRSFLHYILGSNPSNVFIDFRMECVKYVFLYASRNSVTQTCVKEKCTWMFAPYHLLESLSECYTPVRDQRISST